MSILDLRWSNGLPAFRETMTLREAAEFLYQSLALPKWGGYKWRMLRLAIEFAGDDYEQVLNYLGAVIVHNAPYYGRGPHDRRWQSFADFDTRLMVDKGATEMHSVMMDCGLLLGCGRLPVRLVNPIVERRHVVAIARGIPDKKIWTAW